jgi:hypothetical protein
MERPDWTPSRQTAVVPVVDDGRTLLPPDRNGGGEREHEQVDVTAALAADLDPDLVADWEKTGGINHRFGVARRVARQLVEAFPPGDEARFLSDFEALPDRAQSAVLSELALEPDGAVRPASERDLAHFGSTEEGARMVSEWGRRAPRNLAALRARIERILAKAGGATDALGRWFDDLAPDAATAIYRALVR